MAIDTELVRILVGDSDTDTQLLSDDQIEAITTGYTSNRMAAAAVADAISAKFARKVSFSLEGLRFENSTKSEAYAKLAERLRTEAAQFEDSVEIGVLVSGTSIATMDAVEDNDDLPGPRFKAGMQQ